MASHESFYTSSPAPQPPATYPTSPTAPPPPPKPRQHSRDNSRSGTPSQQQQQYTPGPPPPIPPHPNSTQAPPVPPPNPTSTHPPSTPSYQHQQPQIPPPPIGSNWLPPGLPDKSIQDLQSLLSNPALITALAQTHPSYASSLVPLQSLLTTNLVLAQQLSSTEVQLRQLRDQTAQLLLNHTSLQTQWRRKQSEMDDALSPWGPRSMYQRLVSSIAEQEAVLKAMQESFLEGEGGGMASEKEVGEWVRRIREGTTALEKRREMRARWDEGRVGGWR